MGRLLQLNERRGKYGGGSFSKKTALRINSRESSKWMQMEEIENILEVNGSSEKNNFDLS